MVWMVTKIVGGSSLDLMDAQAQCCRVALCRTAVDVYSQTLGFTICSCIHRMQLYMGGLSVVAHGYNTDCWKFDR